MITSRFLLLFSVLFLLSCKKIEEDPAVEFTASQLTADGVDVKAEVTKGAKQATGAGFCFGKTSMPVADLSGYSSGTVQVYLDGKKFSTLIPEHYFESYSGYYIRPYVKRESKIIYGSEIYYEQVQQPFSTPSCSPADNYFNPGAGVVPGAQNYYSVNVTYGPLHEYRIHAQTNNHNVKLEFLRKPKTGIYLSSPYTSSENHKLVYVLLNVGSMSKLADAGQEIHVNEVEKDKFEITFCDLSWKFNSGNTAYASSRIIID